MCASPRDPQLQELGLAWASAERRGDVATLDSLMCEDFVGIGRQGLTLTKQQWLARYIAGDLVQASFAWDSLTVHGFDAAAVLTGVPEHDSHHRNRAIDGQFRASLFVASQSERWRVAALQPVRVKRPARPPILP